MNQDIYFPIKSNIDFFEKKSNQPSLISKIKQSILLYENLYFDEVPIGYPVEIMVHLIVIIAQSNYKILI